jgi:enoyl-CoA hydratase/carnithine racemase
MSDGTVHVERRGHVAVVTLDRPGRRNALGHVMWAALGRAADELHAQPPRAVVLTGAGDAFCAGMDVNPDNPQVAQLVGAVAQQDVAPVRAMLADLHRVLDRLFALPVPIVAALGGLAYGGGAELATRCDLRVADPAATICFSEVRLGLMPDLGGGVALARLIGPGRAADLILTARKVGADEALGLGLFNRVSAPGGVLAEAIGLAEAIAGNGPRAVRAALGVIRGAADLPWREAIAAELEAAAALIATGECQTGITALFARTAPRFIDPPPGVESPP